MGLLDDAIREHLELKRRRGADAGEISREESEALGPVRRAPDGSPDLASIPVSTEPEPPSPYRDDEPDWGDDAVAHTPPPIPAQPPAPGYVMPPPPPPPDPAFDDSAPLPPLEDPETEGPRRERRRLPGAGRLRLRRGQRGEDAPPEDAGAPETAYEPPPVAFAPPPPVAPEPPPGPAADEPAGEDLLEETPEFLEETPDHDRLWFEQRPPRDFDFDK